MEAPGDPAGLPGLLRDGLPGKRARLATLVSRFRGQIEYDLRTVCNGLSLQEFWRERRFRELLNLIDNLPPNSLTQEAIANDEELAEALVAARGGKLPEASKTPPLRSWTQEASLLAQVISELRQLAALLVKINSKPESPAPKVIPVPVPETAYQKIMERAREEARLAKHHSLVRRLLGDRANKGSQ